jgi:hypothetical protein
MLALNDITAWNFVYKFDASVEMPIDEVGPCSDSRITAHIVVQRCEYEPFHIPQEGKRFYQAPRLGFELASFPSNKSVCSTRTKDMAPVPLHHTFQWRATWHLADVPTLLLNIVPCHFIHMTSSTNIALLNIVTKLCFWAHNL